MMGPGPPCPATCDTLQTALRHTARTLARQTGRLCCVTHAIDVESARGTREGAHSARNAVTEQAGHDGPGPIMSKSKWIAKLAQIPNMALHQSCV